MASGKHDSHFTQSLVVISQFALCGALGLATNLERRRGDNQSGIDQTVLVLLYCFGALLLPPDPLLQCSYSRFMLTSLALHLHTVDCGNPRTTVVQHQ